jgi:hypothetical protein
MRTTRLIALLTLAAAAWAPPARADFVLRVPYVTVAVGRPGVTVQVGGGAPLSFCPAAPAPKPAPAVVPAADPAPNPFIVPVPPAAPTKGLTLDEFAAGFRPVAGTHEVVFLHPGSGQPVTVTFTLPEGSPKVRVHKREIVFDYGKHDVEVHFRIGGRVQVRYD